MKYNKLQIITIFFLMAIGVVARFLPHPANFSPVMALALFAGFYLPRKWAIGLPIAVMFITDIFLGFYEFPVMITVYLSFFLASGLGIWMKNKKNWLLIGGGAIGSAIFFFLASNFAVWAFSPWYAKTIAGLSQCFILALPFFKNTLLSNVLYAGAFFAVYEAVTLLAKRYLPASQSLPNS